MALGRSDHKRIALSIAKELQKVLSDANGQRLHGKHKARIAPKPALGKAPTEDPDMEEMMRSMDGEEDMGHEAAEPPEIEQEEEAALKPKRPNPFARRGR